MPLLVRRFASLSLALLLGAGAMAGCGTDEPLPTPPRSASPEVVEPGGSAATSRLAAFEAHLRDTTSRQGQLVRTIGQASAGTPAELEQAATSVRAWVASERAWLDDNPADPCYDGAVAKLEAAVEAMDEAADWLHGIATVTTAPSDDVTRGSMGTETVNALEEASRSLLDAAALATAARPTCG